jgi:hypothetical protein
MRKHLFLLTAVMVLAGFLGSANRVGATQVPALRWDSGDHDIYQTSDRTSPSFSSTDNLSSVHGSDPARVSGDTASPRAAGLILRLWLNGIWEWVIL